MIKIQMDQKTNLLLKKIFFSVTLVLFLFYLFVVLCLKGFFGVFSNQFCLPSDWEPYMLRTKINLIPFKNIWQYTVAIFEGSNSRFGSGIAKNNLLGNLLILLPFPIFLGLLGCASFRAIKNLFDGISSFKSIILVVLIFDILISLIRFAFTIMGIFDIDDIILNLIGGIAGYFLFTTVACKLFDILEVKVD